MKYYIWSVRMSGFFAILLSAMQALGAPSLKNASKLSCAQVFERTKQKVEKMDNVKVAAVQFPLGEKGTPASFLSKVESYIDQAKAGGADLVLFPELITTELVNWQAEEGDIPQLKRIAAEFTPMYTQWLQRKAVEKQVAILGGTTPRLVGDQVVNTAILAMADGQVHLQDKIFLTPDEKDWNWTPGQSLKVIDTPWGKTVITICFDCEFPLIANKLAKFKPELILVPSWTSTMGGLNRVDWSSRGHAVGQYAFVVKTGTVAAEGATQPHYGQASIITPQEGGWPTQPIDGELNKPAIVFGDLNMKKLREKKAASGYYPGNEQGQRLMPLKIETVN